MLSYIHIIYYGDVNLLTWNTHCWERNQMFYSWCDTRTVC